MQTNSIIQLPGISVAEESARLGAPVSIDGSQTDSKDSFVAVLDRLNNPVDADSSLPNSLKDKLPAAGQHVVLPDQSFGLEQKSRDLALTAEPNLLHPTQTIEGMDTFGASLNHQVTVVRGNDIVSDVDVDQLAINHASIELTVDATEKFDSDLTGFPTVASTVDREFSSTVGEQIVATNPLPTDSLTLGSFSVGDGLAVTGYELPEEQTGDNVLRFDQPLVVRMPNASRQQPQGPVLSSESENATDVTSEFESIPAEAERHDPVRANVDPVSLLVSHSYHPTQSIVTTHVRADSSESLTAESADLPSSFPRSRVGEALSPTASEQAGTTDTHETLPAPSVTLEDENAAAPDNAAAAGHAVVDQSTSLDSAENTFDAATTDASLAELPKAAQHVESENADTKGGPPEKATVAQTAVASVNTGSATTGTRTADVSAASGSQPATTVQITGSKTEPSAGSKRTQPKVEDQPQSLAGFSSITEAGLLPDESPASIGSETRTSSSVANTLASDPHTGVSSAQPTIVDTGETSIEAANADFDLSADEPQATTSGDGQFNSNQQHSQNDPPTPLNPAAPQFDFATAFEPDPTSDPTRVPLDRSNEPGVVPDLARTLTDTSGIRLANNQRTALAADALASLPQDGAAGQVAAVFKSGLRPLDQEPVQVMSLELHPAELGHIKIRIEQHAGRLVTQIVASEANASNLLLEQKDALLATLTELGLGETSLDISHGDSRQSNPETFQESQQQEVKFDFEPQERRNKTSELPRPATANGINLIA